MDIDLRAHFLGGLQELRPATMADASQYAVIASTRVLRDFLLDGTLNSVGRSLGRHPRFKTPQDRDPMERNAGTLLEYDAFSLDTRHRLAGQQVEEVSMGRFLSYPMMTIMGEVYSVKVVVRVGANWMGGVHFHNKVASDVERNLIDRMGMRLNDALHADLTEVASAVKQIAQATREACEPLRRQAVARTSL